MAYYSGQETERTADSELQSAKQTAGRFARPAAKGAVKLGKRAGGKAVKLLGKAAVKAGAALGKTIAKAGAALVKLAIAFWPVTLVILGIILVIVLIAAIWTWQVEERGSSGRFSLGGGENPTVVTEDGTRTAVALTEEQALVDAYYKYMACDSHQKIYVCSNSDDPSQQKTLQFSNPDETSDFASLTDYYDKEGYFYLSPYFIQMADELLHDGEFYYPEQLVKPVFSKILPVEGGSGRYITALPLVDDGSAQAQALTDGNPDTNGFAVKESLTSTDGNEPRRPQRVDASKTLLTISKSHVKGEVELHDEDGQALVDGEGNPLKATGLTATQSDTKESGLWDYGFGSVLQYEPMDKEKWIDVQSASFEIHFHQWDWDPEDKIYREHCLGDAHNAKFEIDFSKTAEENIKRLDSLIEDSVSSGEDYYIKVVSKPTSDQIRLMMKDHNHVLMCIQDEDLALSGRIFNDATLQSAFGNGNPATNTRKKRYPLHTSVITAAATFSGNIRYEYTEETSSNELKEQNGTQGNFADDWADDCTAPVYGTVSNPDYDPDVEGSEKICFTGEVTRSGTVYDRHPSANPQEISVPTGFQYVEDYSSNYKIYVPNFVKQDKDFTGRVTKEQEGAYSESLDANGDGKLTLLDFLLKMGLLRPYASGYLSSTGGGFSTGAISAEHLASMQELGCTPDEEGEIRLLAKAIAAEAGPNKLDQLMVGCVIVNRVKSELFPNTMIEVLKAPGQYASWSNGSIKAREPTEEQLSSARQILYGEFAIPSSVVFQAGFTQGQATYMIVDNGGYPFLDNYYCSYGQLSPIDIFGRTALTSEQARDLAQTLHEQDVSGGITTSGGSGISATGQTVTAEVSSDEPLYAVTGFDMAAAVQSMRKVADKESVGFLDSILAHAGAALGGIFEQIQSFFQAANHAFGSTYAGDFVLPYNHNVPLSDMRDMVIQAATFSDQATYSAEKEIFDPDVLQFIFIGKSGWTGFGQGTNSVANQTSVPGVGSAFEGFTSPTTTHYSVSRPFSEVTGSAQVAVPEGVLIQSVGAMTVSSSEQGSDGTYTVSLTGTADGKTLVLRYGNLSESGVSAGQSVSRGDKIGRAAKGGLALTVLLDGKKVDPMRYFYRPTFGSGAAFGNVLGSGGMVDEGLKNDLHRTLNAANRSANGPYDKWHDPANRNAYHVKSVGECTWWAYGRGWQYCEEHGTLPAGGLSRSYGNGGDYYGNGAKDFATGQTARAGSWIVWRRLTPDSRGQYYGHVAFVEAVGADGTVVYSESYRSAWDKGDGNGIRVRTVKNTGSASRPNYAYSSNYAFVGFVYLDSPR